jgi:CofD-related protein of GAK system
VESPVKIIRSVSIPDRLKIERYKRLPELGPHVLFFSGGSAIRSLSQQLINYTYNSIHLITPFDYGGSSRKLRDAFNMISIGDLRNRLMALADQSHKGNPNIYRLFVYRLPQDAPGDRLKLRLKHMAEGIDPLTDSIPEPMKSIICNHLRWFIKKMPDNFDLRGANIGNLILVGGYLYSNYNIDTVVYIFSKLIEARGTVKPLMTRLLHLVAELEDGSRLVGQHLITGKEYPAITIPVKNLYLTDNLDRPEPIRVEIEDDVKNLIDQADLICYPMGSFYSSIVANLLPYGVEEAVASNICPKVYIPNTTSDPEQTGMDLFRSVGTIITSLKKNRQDIASSDLLNYVLIDSKNARYPYDTCAGRLAELGVEIIDTRLVTPRSSPYIDSECLIEVLLSLT